MHKNATTKSYITGFLLSIVLTLAAYFLVANHLLTDKILLTSILGLAVVQLMIQLLFFLHLGKEKKPRWNLMILISFVGIILIIVVGSIIITSHLNYNMMPKDMGQYMLQEEGMQK